MKVKLMQQLKKLTLFSDLSDELLEQIAAASTLKKFSKSNIIFYEGDAPTHLHILLSGQVKLYKTLANSNELILKYFYTNEMIAEVAVFEGFPYPATAEATNDVEMILIEYAKLKTFMLHNPEVLLKIQTSLIKKIKNLETLLSRYLVLDAKSRVIDYILKNEKEFLSLKQTEIATILNISPETLSRILKPFKADGIIDIKAKKINKERLKLYQS